MNSAIVSGATGFIGIHLVHELVSAGVDVVVLCQYKCANLTRIPGSVRVVYELSELPYADVFYHLAWEQASGPGRLDAVLQSKNVTLTLEVLHAANKIGAKFIALGTVYERFADKVSHADKFDNSNFYILAKHSAHNMSNQLAYKLGNDYVWCQICHPIGRYIKHEQLMAYVISSLIDGTPPSFGPAETLYDVVAVEDVAQGLCLLGKQKTPRREYYIGSGNPKPLREILQQTKAILRTDTPLMIGTRPDDGLLFEESWFDISLISHDVGYEPCIGFEQSVCAVADWITKGLG